MQTTPESIAILIPAWQPEPALLSLAAELSQQHLVLVLDDGSNAASQKIFDALPKENVRLLRHAVNLGKGRALKSLFNCVLAEYPHITGVVTADADGQHTAVDILRVAQALAETGKPVLGSRGFDIAVPFRSRFGNTLTRYIFGFVTGTKLRDTQTGLRGFPASLLPEMMMLDGERYEYEMAVLAHLCRGGRNVLEVPIQTVYIDNNRSSHFNPVWDSMRIYFVLARFYFSALLASAIDIAGFSIAFAASHNILLSVAVGRISSLVNFALNRKFVFHADDPRAQSVTSALWRYYTLVLAIAGMSYVLIRTTTTHWHTNVYVTKIVVDVLLSLVSFAAQRTFVFQRKQDA